ncbi:MAG: GUN4 domain-containing protein [Cyanobacteriota bacterium]|nr:GUN4 domain-containing protein [Cyanobacteriota bacterium]
MEWIGLAIVIVLIGAIARFGWVAWKRNSLQNAANIPDVRSAQSPEDGQTFDPLESLEPVSRTEASQVALEKLDEYAKLREFLDRQKYEEADRETKRLMLQIVGARKRGYFELADFETFPSSALQTIDRLWIDRSNGQFGFSVQKRIYQEVEAEYSLLGTRVGWVRWGKWLKMDDGAYALDSPKGHLPYAIWQSQLASFGFFGLGMCVEVFLSRTDL